MDTNNHTASYHNELSSLDICYKFLATLCSLHSVPVEDLINNILLEISLLSRCTWVETRITLLMTNVPVKPFWNCDFYQRTINFYQHFSSLLYLGLQQDTSWKIFPRQVGILFLTEIFYNWRYMTQAWPRPRSVCLLNYLEQLGEAEY